MFLRSKVRRKDGKQHRYWSVVENTRVAGGAWCSGTCCTWARSTTRRNWRGRRSIAVLEDGAARPRMLSLFPEDRCEGLLADASIVRVKLSALQHAPHCRGRRSSNAGQLLRTRRHGSHLTPCWRKTDSNPRSPRERENGLGGRSCRRPARSKEDSQSRACRPCRRAPHGRWRSDRVGRSEPSTASLTNQIVAAGRPSTPSVEAAATVPDNPRDRGGSRRRTPLLAPHRRTRWRFGHWSWNGVHYIRTGPNWDLGRRTKIRWSNTR
jgi:hypothetical protein